MTTARHASCSCVGPRSSDLRIDNDFRSAHFIPPTPTGCRCGSSGFRDSRGAQPRQSIRWRLVRFILVGPAMFQLRSERRSRIRSQLIVGSQMRTNTQMYRCLLDARESLARPHVTPVAPASYRGPLVWLYSSDRDAEGIDVNRTMDDPCRCFSHSDDGQTTRVVGGASAPVHRR